MEIVGGFARNVRFGSFVLWKFEEASHETLVLEACSVKFGGSLARNVRFGSLFFEISKKPRTKRSFWKLVLWNLEEASHKTFVLEACSVKFWGSLARNVRFGSLVWEISRKPRTKRSFWKLVLWNYDEASQETFVLEALFYEIWRKPRAKRPFWSMKFGFGGKCDKTIAGHQPLTTANDKTIADHRPQTTANDKIFSGKCDKTIAGHRPLTTANDKTMGDHQRLTTANDETMVGGFVSFRCHTQLCHIDGWTTLR